MNTKLCKLLVALMVLLLVSGCDSAMQKSPSTNPQSTNIEENVPPTGKNGQQYMQVKVYYATPDAMYLVPKVYEIIKNDAPATTALNILLKGSEDNNLVSVMPKGTKIIDLKIKDNIAYVNFSQEIIKKNIGGSATERLLVGAIVNTLTEFPDIKKVKILVEGKSVETLSGHIDVSEPLIRDEKIIKK